MDLRKKVEIPLFPFEADVTSLVFSLQRESVKSGHHCCPCQAPPPPVLVTTSPNARIIRQSSQPEASACCCSGCCCPLHTGAAPSAASLRQLREPGDGIAGIAADSLRINGGIRQFRQVSQPAIPSLPASSTRPSLMTRTCARVSVMQEYPAFDRQVLLGENLIGNLMNIMYPIRIFFSSVDLSQIFLDVTR